MSFLSTEGWGQELAALVLVALAALYMVRRLRGVGGGAPRSDTPDEVHIGDRLSRALKAAEDKRRGAPPP